ncbi:hypothetical protein HYFRA_00007750 [Hymenoscyphus fraxineus]|uniref:Uncharacterized protein n=1 Tax=Hymenoscyphus fraxineus TaxID=746836 RepID=A0A9N9KM44_9HELO|nr:hypothetical protein HYFRA_00007750 [Hymenoscyphus fraxineus]
MSTENKPQLQSETIQSDFESFDTPQRPIKNPLLKLTNSIHLGLTVLALLSSIAILSTSAKTLSTYNKTNDGGEDWMIPLWPRDFDIRPTIALVACSAVILISSGISLAIPFIPTLPTPLKTTLSLLAPTTCLIASLIGTALFYGVNTSRTTSSLQSWSCQWRTVEMGMQPHWGSLCKQSKSALYLMVMMIPLEVGVLFAVGAGMVLVRRERVSVRVVGEKGSPGLS